MTINSKIKTILTCKEIAVIVVALGNYQDNSLYLSSDQKQFAKNIVDRLGNELYGYPKDDFTQKE